MYKQAWHYQHPPKTVGSTAVIVTFSCHLTGHAFPTMGALSGEFVIEPVAIVVVDSGGAVVVFARDASREQIEDLLSDEAGWSEVV